MVSYSTTLFLSKLPKSRLPVKVPILLPVTDNLPFLNQGKSVLDGSVGLGTSAYEADMLPI